MDQQGPLGIAGVSRGSDPEVLPHVLDECRPELLGPSRGHAISRDVIGVGDRQVPALGGIVDVPFRRDDGFRAIPILWKIAVGAHIQVPGGLGQLPPLGGLLVGLQRPFVGNRVDPCPHKGGVFCGLGLGVSLFVVHPPVQQLPLGGLVEGDEAVDIDRLGPDVQDPRQALVDVDDFGVCGRPSGPLNGDVRDRRPSGHLGRWMLGKDRGKTTGRVVGRGSGDRRLGRGLGYPASGGRVNGGSNVFGPGACFDSRPLTSRGDSTCRTGHMLADSHRRQVKGGLSQAVIPLTPGVSRLRGNQIGPDLPGDHCCPIGGQVDPHQHRFTGDHLRCGIRLPRCQETLELGYLARQGLRRPLGDLPTQVDRPRSDRALTCGTAPFIEASNACVRGGRQGFGHRLQTEDRRGSPRPTPCQK